MMNTPVPGLVPSPTPQEAALHPQAVQVRADQPADPHAMLGAFEQLLVLVLVLVWSLSPWWWAPPDPPEPPNSPH